jgi:hypothetical protein
MVSRVCNPNSGEAEARGLEIEVSLGYTARLCLKTTIAKKITPEYV